VRWQVEDTTMLARLCINLVLIGGIITVVSRFV
jgi:hypothetical protein